MTRTQARQLLMQMVFQMEAQQDFSEETMQKLTREHQIPGSHQEYIETTFRAIRDNITAIDESINKYSRHWKVTRMPKADLAILRTAVGEICYKEDVPNSVAINEAVNLAKTFGGDDSPAFINGILGNIANEQ